MKAEYDALAEEYDIAAKLIAARKAAGMSQVEVAERMGTTQTVISRMESGRHRPSLGSIHRYAAATGAKATIEITPA
ncbi:MAG: helix-turn-helix transcriptional regulator [Alphaproteobacteria bacterium]|nr:helix-turn-helix transcriptional regulator [Alphaproteobacteria bacterium]